MASDASKPTIGWWYGWALSPNVDSFSQLSEVDKIARSHFWPQWSSPLDVETPLVPSFDNFIGWWNDAHSAEDANVSPTESATYWNDFGVWLRNQLALLNNVEEKEIKLVGPSIQGNYASSMNWAEEFYFRVAKQNEMVFDALNVHHFDYGGRKCDCSSPFLRDQLSHLRTKFDLPICLTEFK